VDFLVDSVSALAAAVQLGDLSAREMVTHALERIDALDKRVNAFVAVNPEQALADAADVDERQARGEDVGALAGIPLAVKDLEDAAGFATTNGSLVATGADPAQADSKLVGRLKQAGAIVIGKTNTPEHGWTGQTYNPRFGTTRNPWDLTRSPGGSSGGSAAAVAAGMVPLATGSDGGGSIRIPSSVCGLSGFKPSLGRVPMGDAAPPGWPLLSTRGTMAWTVADLAASLDVAIGPDPADLRSLPMPEASWLGAVRDPHVPLRVAWSPTLGYAEVDREVLDACTRVVGMLADLGAEIVEIDDVFDEDPVIPWVLLVNGFMHRTFANVRHTADWQRITPELRDQLEQFEDISVVDFVRAGDTAHALNLRLLDVFADARLLLTPTVAGQTPVCGAQGTINGVEMLNWVGFTYPFNMTCSPAGTVCAGLTADGLPIGLQLVGPQHGDLVVLRAMAAVEAAIGFTARPDPASW
jgi:Asp-tRNA(Asn)/Glu-tRNA(Gln) amidotransferase A subunit family amidase